MSNQILKDKVCIVTGAARGIGKAVALKYAENGASVAVIDLNKEGVEQTAKEIKELGVNSIAVAADISSAQGIDDAVSAIEKQFPVIDILANCAGISTSKLMTEVAENDWDPRNER